MARAGVEFFLLAVLKNRLGGEEVLLSGNVDRRLSRMAEGGYREELKSEPCNPESMLKIRTGSELLTWDDDGK